MFFWKDIKKFIWAHSNKIVSERGNIIIDAKEIQTIIKTTMYNYMPKIQYTRRNIFLETYNLPRWNHKETANLNSTINSMAIEAVIKSLITKTSQAPTSLA